MVNGESVVVTTTTTPVGGIEPEDRSRLNNPGSDSDPSQDRADLAPPGYSFSETITFSPTTSFSSATFSNPVSDEYLSANREAPTSTASEEDFRSTSPVTQVSPEPPPPPGAFDVSGAQFDFSLAESIYSGDVQFSTSTLSTEDSRALSDLLAYKPPEIEEDLGNGMARVKGSPFVIVTDHDKFTASMSTAKYSFSDSFKFKGWKTLDSIPKSPSLFSSVDYSTTKESGVAHRGNVISKFPGEGIAPLVDIRTGKPLSTGKYGVEEIVPRVDPGEISIENTAWRGVHSNFRTREEDDVLTTTTEDANLLLARARELEAREEIENREGPVRVELEELREIRQEMIGQVIRVGESAVVARSDIPTAEDAQRFIRHPTLELAALGARLEQRQERADREVQQVNARSAERVSGSFRDLNRIISRVNDIIDAEQTRVPLPPILPSPIA